MQNDEESFYQSCKVFLSKIGLKLAKIWALQGVILSIPCTFHILKWAPENFIKNVKNIVFHILMQNDEASANKSFKVFL